MSWLISHRQELEILQILMSTLFYLFGMFGVVVAVLTLRANRQNQRENNARRAYFELARLGIDHPKFAFPKLLNLDLEAQTVESSRETFERYEWFVSCVLATVKFILESSGREHLWRKMMVLQLAYHWRYFERFQHEKEFMKIWSEDLRSELEEGIAIGHSQFV